MRRKLISASLILMFAFTSCKNEVSSNAEDGESTKNNFEVVLEGVFAKNDKFQVFYMVGGKFSEDNSVFVPVYGSDKMQTIDIDLPEGIKPENIRVDIGMNETQGNVTLKNISVKHKDNLINGDNDKFTKYFDTNAHISWDNNYFGYKLSTIDNAYDPFFMGNDILITKLKQMK